MRRKTLTWIRGRDPYKSLGYLMIILSWNVRGMNAPNRTKEIKQYLDRNHISLVGLLETRVKDKNKKRIQNKFVLNRCWVSNYDHHRKGRVWVGWRRGMDHVDIVRKHTQYIAVQVLSNTHGKFMVVFIYGLHTVTDRKELWIQLRTLQNQSPTLFIGGYNAIYNADQRHGSHATTYEINDMHMWLEEMDLRAFKEQGHEFSWSNRKEGENRIMFKIDHAIGNIAWMSSYAAFPMQYDNAHSLDHCPLMVKLSYHTANTQKPFRFMNYLIHHPIFLQKIEKVW